MLALKLETSTEFMSKVHFFNVTVQFHDDRNLMYLNVIVIVLILIYFMIMVHEDWISLITLLVLHRGFYVIHPTYSKHNPS